MGIKIVYMNAHRDAVDKVILHLDKIYGMAWNWTDEYRRWEREFGLQIMRTNIGDSIMFQSEEEYMLWLLKWS